MQVNDTKAIVMAALARHVPDAEVVSVRPDGAGEPPPGGLIRVISTGGQGRSQRVLYTGQVTVDSYAATTGQAMSLALSVDAVVHALVNGHEWPVTNVSGAAPHESPDPDTASPRVTATYQITTRNTGGRFGYQRG